MWTCCLIKSSSNTYLQWAQFHSLDLHKHKSSLCPLYHSPQPPHPSQIPLGERKQQWEHWARGSPTHQKGMLQKHIGNRNEITSLISHMQKQEPNLLAGSKGICSTYDRLSSGWSISLAVPLGLGYVYAHIFYIGTWYKHSIAQQLHSNSSNKGFKTSFSLADKNCQKITLFSGYFSSLPRKFWLRWLRFFQEQKEEEKTVF